MAQWAHYSTPDEEYLQALANSPPRALSLPKEGVVEEQLLIQNQKSVVEAFRKMVQQAGPPVGLTVEEKRLPVSTPPGEITIRIYIPSTDDVPETFPLYIQLHGGGYHVGNVNMDELFCRELSSKHHLIVVNVEYRLAPQFPFPTGVEDSYEAVQWAASNASNIRADLKKGFLIGGISAGANFVCVVTQRARNDPELQGKITGQVLQIPNTISSFDSTPKKIKEKIISREQNKNDPILTPEYRALVRKAYKVEDASDLRASPLLAESFAGLPPAYVQIAGADALRDEGLLYHQFIQEAGIPTKLDIYTGVPHGFAQAYPQLQISAKWRADLDAGVRWLLELAKHRST